MDTSSWTQVQEIEHLKQQGDDCMKTDDAYTAINYYTEAVDIMSAIHDMDQQLEAKIWSNRSAAHMKIKDYQQALLDAKCAVTAWPDWYKCYIRLSKAYEGLKTYHESFKMHHKALLLLKCQPGKYDLLVEILVSECSLVCRVQDIDPKLAATCFYAMAKPFDTHTMLCMIGTQDRFDLLYDLIQMNLNKSMKQNIYSMFHRAINGKFYPSQEKYYISGLDTGVFSLDHYKDKENMPATHFGVNRARRSGSTKLLEYLLTNHFTTRAQVSRIDSHGGTVLHYLFMDSLSDENQAGSIQVLQCLKSFDHVDLKMKDRQGRTVHEVPVHVYCLQWLLELCKPDKQKPERVPRAAKKESSTKPAETERKSSGKDQQQEEKQEDGEARGKQISSDDQRGKKDEMETMSDLESEKRRLKAKLEEVKEKLKSLETQRDVVSASCSDQRLIKCEIIESEVKLELPLSKLPDALSKLGVIELH